MHIIHNAGDAVWLISNCNSAFAWLYLQLSLNFWLPINLVIHLFLRDTDLISINFSLTCLFWFASIQITNKFISY